MTEDKQKIIDKIKKLLALSTSDSIGEAASAAAKAQELMERHSIQEAMLRNQEQTSSNPNITSIILWRGGKVPSWMLQLACGIGEVNRCKVWYRAGRRSKGYDGCIEAAGTAESLEKMSVLLDWLRRETDRLYHEEKPDDFDRGDGKRWANAFRLGASSTIVKRLQEAAAKARREMESGGPNQDEYRLALENADIESLMRLDAERVNRTIYLPAQVQSALVRLDNEVKMVHAWVQAKHKLKTSHRDYRGSFDEGYVMGREAGKRANLHGPAKGA